MAARGHAVGCGVCDTPEPGVEPRVCVRVRARVLVLSNMLSHKHAGTIVYKVNPNVQVPRVIISEEIPEMPDDSFIQVENKNSLSLNSVV